MGTAHEDFAKGLELAHAEFYFETEHVGKQVPRSTALDWCIWLGALGVAAVALQIGLEPDHRSQEIGNVAAAAIQGVTVEVLRQAWIEAKL